MKRLAASLLFLLILLLLVGCASSQAEIPGKTATASTAIVPTGTETPKSTETPSPTAVPTATATLTETPTATITLTPTATIEIPTQLSSVLQDVRVTDFDGFDYLDTDKWSTQACQTANDGVVSLTNCRGGWLGRKHDFQEGEGVMIDFNHVKQTDDYYWGVNLSSGIYGKDDWRNFGISGNRDYGQSITLMKGNTWLGSNPRWTKADVWYRVLLAVDKNGKLLLLVWERDKPSQKPWKYVSTMGKDWAGLKWFFFVNNDKNETLLIDNFTQVAFSKIK